MKLWSLKGKHILIIDDFPGMRSMLRNMLASYNAEHIADASNGEEAMNLLSSHEYDIILCDYNLGEGKDGQQVLEEAKEREILPYSSIFIITTAENTTEMVMGAVEYKPDDYLSKPFTKEVLISRLKRLMKKKSSLKNISTAIQQRDYVLAREYCDKELAKNPGNRLEILKIKTELCIKLQDYNLAESVLKTVLDDRDIPWALLYLGEAHFLRGNYDEARYIFEDLIEDNPNYLAAHDWLAKIYEQSGDSKKSQKILENAVVKSPKSILRQKKLANLAFENEDYDESESAFKRVIRIGKNSCYRESADFSGLAKVYIRKGQNVDALKTISNMKETFTHAEPSEHMKSLINEIIIYQELGRDDDSLSRLHEAINLFRDSPASLSSDNAILLAEICYKKGLVEEGNLLVKHAIRNNHSDQNAIDTITKQLSQFGIDKDSIAQLLKTRDEVVEINNRGVQMAKIGELSESISLFVKAASAMPENAVINLNTAQSMIMFMQKFGVQDELLTQTKKYLEKVSFEGTPSDKYRILMASFRKLQNSLN
jgi:DNA-binding NarL/FixJ family response regulator